MSLTRDGQMPWGKHKGTLLSNVPVEYFKFIRGQDWINEDNNVELRAFIDHEYPELSEGAPEPSERTSGGSDATCRDCGKPVIWIKSDGKNIPLSASPVQVAGSRAFQYHFDTCSQSNNQASKPSSAPAEEFGDGQPPLPHEPPPGVDLDGTGSTDEESPVSPDDMGPPEDDDDVPF